MNIDLDQNETKFLLRALRMLQAHIKEETKEFVELEKVRKENEAKRKPFVEGMSLEEAYDCCCGIDGPSEEEKFINRLNAENETCVNLRDKFKMHQMKFPCEEHNYKRYDYGEEFGYEKCNWGSKKGIRKYHYGS